MARAKAELLELETGKRPAWAAKPAEPEPDRVTGRTAHGHDEPRARGGRRLIAAYSSRRSVAQAVSSWRFDSCSLRSTDDTCVSTVFTDTWMRAATSL